MYSISTAAAFAGPVFGSIDVAIAADTRKDVGCVCDQLYFATR